MSGRADRMYPFGTVAIREVGLRDGLQLSATFPSTEAKCQWIDIEHAAGLRHFEVGSYLPKARFPQFADIDLIDHLSTSDGAFCSVLAVNQKGAELALAGQADEVICVVSASEAHSEANARQSRQSAVEGVAQALRLRKEMRPEAIICGAISMAFGCSIAGAVPGAEVMRLAEQLVEAGVDVIGLADTVGFAGPRQVAGMITSLRRQFPEMPVAIHLHDTRGLGIANVAAAINAGVRIVDASLGGLGGCPFAPGATGNVVIEDVLFLCQTMGIATGVDVEALLGARSLLSVAMPNEALSGAVARAGLPQEPISPIRR